MGGTTLKSAVSWMKKINTARLRKKSIPTVIDVKWNTTYLYRLHQTLDLQLIQNRRERSDDDLHRDTVNFLDVTRVDRSVVVFISRRIWLSGHYWLCYARIINLHPCYGAMQKTKHKTTVSDVVVNESTLPGYLLLEAGVDFDWFSELSINIPRK